MISDTFSEINSAWLQIHSRLLLDSYKHCTGEDLLSCEASEILPEELFNADFVLASHSGGPDPVLNYGNRTALDLWEMNWTHFTTTPSRYTAEPDERETREQLLEQVKARGMVKNYSGIRISSSGQKFKILDVTIWTVTDAENTAIGQAAMFRKWDYLR